MKSILLTVVVMLSLAAGSSCGRFSQGEVKKAEVTSNPAQATPAPQATPAAQATSRFPVPTGLVNDYANVLDTQSRSRLDSLLKNLKTKANIEFAVVTLETTAGEPIFDYSLALAREWGIGPKDTSVGGGLLLLVAVKQREWRLQVSRALEKDLPDEVCKELGEQSTPLYKRGDYAGGIEKYVRALVSRLEKQRNFSLD